VYAVKDGDKSNLKILNWSSENQTLSYSFLILKNGFSLLKEAGHVVLFITPFSFWGKEADDKNRIRYDFFLDRFLLYFHDAKKFHLRDYVFLNVINRRRKDSVFLRAFAYYPVMYPIKAVKLLLELNERENILKNEKRIPGRRHYKPYTVQNDLSTIEKNCIENKKIVLELCRFLQERNLRLVVAVPPAPKDVLSYYQAIFLEKNITDIANSGINIPVLNYLDRQEFCNDDLYLDGRRLNSTGRDLFTECLLQDIENL
jgi:hypothetical protein